MAEFRGSPMVTEEQWDAFFVHLEKTGNVSASAKQAGFNRWTAQDNRKRRPEISERWDDALAGARDVLRAEMHRRGVSGVPEVVISMGKIVIDPATKKPMVQLKYSDAVLIAMAKALIPDEYNRPPPAASAPEIPAELLPDPVPTPDEQQPANPII